MDFYPPIFERTDKELFNMISDSKKWDCEASELAYNELLNRNYSQTEIDAKNNKLQQIIENYANRTASQRKINLKASYTIYEMLLVIIGFPFRIFINGGILKRYWALDKFNYKRKIIQRIVLTIIAIVFWGFILRLILNRQ